MSDETLRKAGRAELDRLNAQPQSRETEDTPRKPRKQVESSYKGLLGIGKKKTLRRVDQEVNKAIDEAPKPKFD